MFQIIPAILEYDEALIKQRIEEALTFSKTLHIDIIDSAFSQNQILPPAELFRPYTDDAFLELHMMINNPELSLQNYDRMGFRRFIGHVEHMSDPLHFIQLVKQFGKEVFLGIDFDTPVEPYLNTETLARLDGFTVMTIRAGQSGQAFIPDAISKVSKIRSVNKTINIETDGGMNEQSVLIAKQAGVNLFACNSYLFQSSDPAGTYSKLQQLISA